MKEVAILTGGESDIHLSEPVYRKLEKLGIYSHFIKLSPNNIEESYRMTKYMINLCKYDFVLAIGDRTEQVGGVLAAFQNKVPIGHLYAGDLNTVATTYDDIHRHSISLYSNLLFCSCDESFSNIRRIMFPLGLLDKEVYVVGATHFDRINIDIIKEATYGFGNLRPYALILINSETLGNDKQLIEDTVTKFMITCTNGVPNVIIAKGNGDNENIETEIFRKISERVNNTISIVRENRKDHRFFLSLIAHAEFFITNSSSVIYEAPFLMNQKNIIHIGNRNKGRTQIPKEAHDGRASERVAKYIKDFLEVY